MKSVGQARNFAIEHHGEQRYGDQPYAYHLDAVAALLEPYSDVAQVIGYLHDVVEDTAVTLEQVAELFGQLVAGAVGILTDQSGDDRKQRKQKTYALMAEVTGELEIALLVKTADRLANVQACVDHDRPDKLRMYQQEHPTFRQAVYRQGLCDELWERLDGLVMNDLSGDDSVLHKTG